ncbi:hypothetical protein EVAR_42683_1 [Eumeta japonica]|uniref:Uncharacterized protein n=1 Tax=Eumeta variegata TaxID=151549 RepID=A0A4C1WYQ7_EUMVA|nr:hypothetical protein EVAR_42683_1 [Eumeta japonica]
MKVFIVRLRGAKPQEKASRVVANAAMVVRQFPGPSTVEGRRRRGRVDLFIFVAPCYSHPRRAALPPLLRFNSAFNSNSKAFLVILKKLDFKSKAITRERSVASVRHESEGTRPAPPALARDYPRLTRRVPSRSAY